MRFIVTLERDETGVIVAECSAIPGCVSQGKTEDEAVENIREANGMPLTVVTREIEIAV